MGECPSRLSPCSSRRPNHRSRIVAHSADRRRVAGRAGPGESPRPMRPSWRASGRFGRSRPRSCTAIISAATRTPTTVGRGNRRSRGGFRRGTASRRAMRCSMRRATGCTWQRRMASAAGRAASCSRDQDDEHALAHDSAVLPAPGVVAAVRARRRTHAFRLGAAHRFVPVAAEPQCRWIDRDDNEIHVLIGLANRVLEAMRS